MFNCLNYLGDKQIKLQEERKLQTQECLSMQILQSKINECWRSHKVKISALITHLLKAMRISL